MAGHRTIGGRAHVRRLALCCTLLAAGSWTLPAPAKDAAELAISVAAPEGFADLAAKRRASYAPVPSDLPLADLVFAELRRRRVLG